MRSQSPLIQTLPILLRRTIIASKGKSYFGTVCLCLLFEVFLSFGVLTQPTCTSFSLLIRACVCICICLTSASYSLHLLSTS
ncbi:hypothetical protein CC78DRAFT_245114 [Lojkania enalia]|uniref:Uncharacterized protein n=1 Tax=Lojkania enalia TaxID=147567 RepID=A0A9P4KAI1_9PLEO|nr:hypothetical protein CC78DRAFT_245114 [Didymosphaeria enalia]